MKNIKKPRVPCHCLGAFPFFWSKDLVVGLRSGDPSLSSVISSSMSSLSLGYWFLGDRDMVVAAMSHGGGGKGNHTPWPPRS